MNKIQKVFRLKIRVCSTCIIMTGQIVFSPELRAQGIQIFSEPVLSTVSEGVPVYTYGYTDVLGESPDLFDTIIIQEGNPADFTKVRPKKSWEIKFNRLGSNTPRMPRTAENDYLPLEPVNLIDGDEQTCWSSRSSLQTDAEPAWIRIDLPVERVIQNIILRKRPPGMVRGQPGMVSPDQNAVEVGMGMPGVLTIRISRDGKNWATVFDGESLDSPESREFTCSFDPVPAKQILITGTNLPKVENWLHSFTIAEVEITGTEGQNLALVNRGTGVAVSSTQHSMGQTRDEHRWLWPLHYDLGLKWIRVGYHDDPINWHWVEKTKGELIVDAEADSAISFLVDRGIDIYFVLAFGNRLYTQPDPSRKLPQLWEWYYENPKPPTTPEALEAWERFVRFSVKHFKDRVKVFEIWNEWNQWGYWGDIPDFAHYMELVRRTIPIIREEAPDAKIMLGSPAGFMTGMSGWTDETLEKREKEWQLLMAISEWAEEVDIIGWHPFYQPDIEGDLYKSYADDIRVFKKWANEQGFQGEFSSSEWNVSMFYPAPTPPNWWGNLNYTELDKAKYIARISVLHTALDVSSFFCETWNNVYSMDLGLLRRSYYANPVSVMHPQAGYYAMRNLATALDELTSADFNVLIEGQSSEIKSFEMQRKGEKVLAIWMPGYAKDDFESVPVQISISGSFKKVLGYDCMNGVMQELQTRTTRKGIRLDGIMVPDYPLLIRFIE